MSIDLEYKEIILNLVRELCPNKKKSKYSFDYYLENIIHVLKDVVTWKSLQILYKKGTKLNHYKTIEAMYIKWSKLEIFKKAYYILLKKYKLININSSTTLNLFIDVSLINNKNGTILTNFGVNKKKKITKMSAICDDSRTVFGVTFHDGKVHDVKTVEKSIDDVIERIKFRKINLIGDKGYIMSREDKEKLLNKKVKMVAPTRKNQKKKTNKKDKKLLRNRYKIENVFQALKKYNRIDIRRDRLIETYESFVFLGLILNFSK